MNIQHWFFTSLAVALLGIIISLVNIAFAVGRRYGVRIEQVVLIHLVAWAFYFFGGIGVLGFGIAWIIQAIKT